MHGLPSFTTRCQGRVVHDGAMGDQAGPWPACTALHRTAPHRTAPPTVHPYTHPYTHPQVERHVKAGTLKSMQLEKIGGKDLRTFCDDHDLKRSGKKALVREKEEGMGEECKSRRGHSAIERPPPARRPLSHRRTTSPPHHVTTAPLAHSTDRDLLRRYARGPGSTAEARVEISLDRAGAAALNLVRHTASGRAQIKRAHGG